MHPLIGRIRQDHLQFEAQHGSGIFKKILIVMAISLKNRIPITLFLIRAHHTLIFVNTISVKK
jgi:hypothetical protein